MSSAQTPISQFPDLGGVPAANDWLLLVDRADGSGGAFGTTKHMTVAELFTGPSIANAQLTGTTHADASAVDALVLTDDVAGRVTLGRFNSGNPFSYFALSASSTGFKFQNAGFSDLLTISDTGELTLIGNLVIDGDTTLTGKFGCNSKAAQGAVAAGTLLGTFALGAEGFASVSDPATIWNAVKAIQSALVANGILV